MPDTNSKAVVLTVAGSDSGGGAGIQADLKTFCALGVFGASALTCITAQNPDEVRSVFPLPPEAVADQIAAVMDVFPVAAAKTGMLYSKELISVVSDQFSNRPPAALVVDPVMVATSGARLLREEAVEALVHRLLPLATVITPNVEEAEILAGKRITTIEDLETVARRLSETFRTACVVKGGHLRDEAEEGAVVDVLCCDGEIDTFRSERIAAVQTHGTGCTFSAALAAFLAKGMLLSSAVEKAKRFVSGALKESDSIGRFTPLNWHAGVAQGLEG